MFVDEQLRWAGLYPQPPVDVLDLARRLGVTEIRTAALFEDGRLEVGGEQIRILLRRNLSLARRRFTIAHELAHLLIEDRPMAAKRESPAGNEIERKCDEIAAGILLPYYWVQESYGGRPQLMATVRDLSETAQVSMGAALLRLKEVVGWHHSLLRWKRDAQRWRFVAGSGVPRRIFGSIQSAPNTSAALDALLPRARTDCVAELPLSVRSSPWHVRAEVSIRGRTAIALTDLLEASSRMPKSTY